MNRNHCQEWGRRGFAFLILLLLAASLFMAVPAAAGGGLAISGSFYRQAFEIPQGSSVSAPSIYVVVFNQSDEEMMLRMEWEAPLGVNINLSHDDFALQAGGQQQVRVGVEVSEDAVPGEYEISIIAKSYKEDVSGIQLMGSASQDATLVVVGESASVKVQAVSPDGEPVTAVVRLFKVIDGEKYEFAYSATGTLEKTVSPGSFTASAYLLGERLASESFEVAADEEKTVNLIVKTVYFEAFDIVPGTGELTLVQLVYTLKNLYQPVDNAEVFLLVTRDGVSLGKDSLATFSPLEMGRIGLRYNYMPFEGWVDGLYGFKLQLNLNGEPYTSTQEKQLNVSGGEVIELTSTPTPAPSGGEGISPAAIGGIVVAVLVIAGMLYLLVRRRRTESGE